MPLRSCRARDSRSCHDMVGDRCGHRGPVHVGVRGRFVPLHAVGDLHVGPDLSSGPDSRRIDPRHESGGKPKIATPGAHLVTGDRTRTDSHTSVDSTQRVGWVGFVRGVGAGRSIAVARTKVTFCAEGTGLDGDGVRSRSSRRARIDRPVLPSDVRGARHGSTNGTPSPAQRRINSRTHGGGHVMTVSPTSSMRALAPLVHASGGSARMDGQSSPSPTPDADARPGGRNRMVCAQILS